METLRQENVAFRRNVEETEADQQSHHSGDHPQPNAATTDEERRKINQQIRIEVAKQMCQPTTVDQLLTNVKLSYSKGILAVPIPPKFKVPQIEAYDRSKDPLEHLETFKVHMTLHGFPSEIACRAFPLTLKGAARVWFVSLRPGTVDSVNELAHRFLMQFMASRTRRRPAAYLLIVKQRDDESLKSYLSHFNKERMVIDDQDEKITLAALLGGIWPHNSFMTEIARKTPSTLREFMDRADGYINGEDTLQALMTPRKRDLERADKKTVERHQRSNQGVCQKGTY
ncbi:hypothetical protein F2P56_015390 [Juglans regia]|uniref:Retrotransposon gag domain-containing protein n=2 Tax=Juglans regia TaxID=51240 RepID=A0A833XFG1_JUGRE|nr:uncharacterized protein LOC108987570 [Juglans regia]KAF5465376.1 hypothetical protein F2P56_015390 [Juglans regia]